MYPTDVLKDVKDISDADPEILVKLFKNSVTFLINIDPHIRKDLIVYLINIAMADEKLNKEEVDFIHKVGSNMMGLSGREISRIFASVIQQKYIPNIESIC